VKLNDSLAEIGPWVFCDCAALTDLVIPNSVADIQKCAFYGCTSLQNVTLPSSITAINEGVFYHCKALKSIVIPNSVTTIYDWAFCGDTSLSDVQLSDQLTSIGYVSFAEVPLKSIKFPETLTSIGDYCFEECESLASIDLPASVATIGLGAFGYCTELTTATSRNTTPPAITDNIFAESPIGKVYVPEESVSSYKADANWGAYNIIGFGAGVADISVEANNAAVKCYNLNGVRVNPDTLTPGLYIINGKKTVVK
jgi:hypothetical protein